LNNKKTIKQILEENSKKFGSEIRIKSFSRYECGEGIERKENNFAEEVAKLLK